MTLSNMINKQQMVYTCKKKVFVIGRQLGFGFTPNFGLVLHKDSLPFNIPSLSMFFGIP